MVKESEPEPGQTRLLTLARRLLEHQEADRRRIAAVLHDDVGQLLTAIKLTLSSAGASDGGEGAGEAIEEARDLTSQALERVRDVTLDLRPAMLDDLGLADTLDWYLRRSAGSAGLQLELDLTGLESRLPSRQETCAFRVVQEAVANVTGHAAASRVAVRVRRAGARLVLEVTDDGRGFDVPAALQCAREGGSFGLSGMEERLMLEGGTLEIESRAGRGTRLVATLPLETRTGGRE